MACVNGSAAICCADAAKAGGAGTANETNRRAAGNLSRARRRRQIRAFRVDIDVSRSDRNKSSRRRVVITRPRPLGTVTGDRSDVKASCQRDRNLWHDHRVRLAFAKRALRIQSVGCDRPTAFTDPGAIQGSISAVSLSPTSRCSACPFCALINKPGAVNFSHPWCS